MCLVGEDKNNGNLHNPSKRLRSPFLLSSLSCHFRPLPLLLMNTVLYGSRGKKIHHLAHHRPVMSTQGYLPR